MIPPVGLWNDKFEDFNHNIDTHGAKFLQFCNVTNKPI